MKQTQNYVLSATLTMKQTFNLFVNCTKTNILWANIKEFFNGNLKLPY